MFVTIEDFIKEWKNESAGTQKLLNVLTDESLSQAVTMENRTLGQIAWHIAATIHEMVSQTGLNFDSAGTERDVPDAAADIAQAYHSAAQALQGAIKSQWTDANLSESCNLYGDEWKNGLTLRILIQHEIHHRGQMTVLMRQAGLPVPGLYGPSKEEWSKMGMEPPKI